MCPLIYRVIRIAAMFAALWAAAPAGAAADTVAATAVRIGDYSVKTRFVLDITARVDYSVFSLANPYRVVIDLPEMDWRLKGDASGKGLVTGYRYGLFRPGQSRMVIDVGVPVVVAKKFLLPADKEHGYRLVVDLKKTTRQIALQQVYRPGKAATPPAPAARPTPLKRQGDRRIIVVDPGHGGVDPGAIGRSGSREKYITLAQARELRRQLEATGRYKVVMTRNRDIFVRLRDRIAVAQDAGADLFISLHADSMRNNRVRGGSVYTLSEVASDKEAEALAAKENRADLIAGIDLSDQSEVVAKILIDLRQRLTMNDSAVFAKALVRELGKTTLLLRNTHRFAGFAVLKAPDIPSVLVEMGYLSNGTDERLLSSRKQQKRVAAAVVKAVNRYFITQEARKRP